MEDYPKEIIDAAYNLIRQIQMPHEDMTLALSGILNNPSFEEKWLILIKAFQDDKDLKQIIWRTYGRARTYKREEAVIFVENKISFIDNKAKLLLRKIMDIGASGDLEDILMKRYVLLSSELQRYEDMLELIGRRF